MDCKVELQVGTSSLRVEGSETFVTSTLESWRPFFVKSPGDERGDTPQAAQGMPQNDASRSAGLGGQSYENVFDYADGKLKIIAHITGANKADITRKTALVLLFGRLLDGSDVIPSEEIRQACMDQGCYDPANFAQYLKGLKSRVAMNTKPGGGYDVKLTAPGRKDARELVERLNEVA